MKIQQSFGPEPNHDDPFEKFASAIRAGANYVDPATGEPVIGLPNQDNVFYGDFGASRAEYPPLTSSSEDVLPEGIHAARLRAWDPEN